MQYLHRVVHCCTHTQVPKQSSQLMLVHNCIVLSLLPVKSTSKAKSNIGYYKKKKKTVSMLGKGAVKWETVSVVDSV